MTMSLCSAPQLGEASKINLNNLELATGRPFTSGGRPCTRTDRPFTRTDQCGENPAMAFLGVWVLYPECGIMEFQYTLENHSTADL